MVASGPWVWVTIIIGFVVGWLSKDCLFLVKIHVCLISNAFWLPFEVVATETRPGE